MLRVRLKEANFAKDADPGELTALAERYAAGRGRADRDRLIQLLGLRVLGLVKAPRRQRDDAEGEALLGLVECLERWPDVWRDQDNDVRRYVDVSVRRRVGDFLRDDQVFRVRARRIRECVASGRKVPRTRQLLNDDPAVWPGTPVVWPDTTLDLRELFTPDDWRLLEARAHGVKYQEIGRGIGRSKGWLTKKFRELDLFVNGFGKSPLYRVEASSPKHWRPDVINLRQDGPFLPLHQVADYLREHGVPASVSSVMRWAKEGVGPDAVRLRTVKIGGRLFTNSTSIDAFVDALNKSA